MPRVGLFSPTALTGALGTPIMPFCLHVEVSHVTRWGILGAGASVCQQIEVLQDRQTRCCRQSNREPWRGDRSGFQRIVFDKRLVKRVARALSEAALFSGVPRAAALVDDNPQKSQRLNPPSPAFWRRTYAGMHNLLSSFSV